MPPDIAPFFMNFIAVRERKNRTRQIEGADLRSVPVRLLRFGRESRPGVERRQGAHEEITALPNNAKSLCPDRQAASRAQALFCSVRGLLLRRASCAPKQVKQAAQRLFRFLGGGKRVILRRLAGRFFGFELPGQFGDLGLGRLKRLGGVRRGGFRRFGNGQGDADCRHVRRLSAV